MPPAVDPALWVSVTKAALTGELDTFEARFQRLIQAVSEQEALTLEAARIYALFHLHGQTPVAAPTVMHALLGRAGTPGLTDGFYLATDFLKRPENQVLLASYCLEGEYAGHTLIRMAVDLPAPYGARMVGKLIQTCQELGAVQALDATTAPVSTPLGAAIIARKLDVAKALIEGGADLDREFLIPLGLVGQRTTARQLACRSTLEDFLALMPPPKEPAPAQSLHIEVLAQSLYFGRHERSRELLTHLKFSQQQLAQESMLLVGQEQDEGEYTLLYCAAFGGDLDSVCLLLDQAGSNAAELLTIADRDGYTPAAAAVGKGHYEIVSELIKRAGLDDLPLNDPKRQAFVNPPMGGGFYLIHDMWLSNNPVAVAYLLKQGVPADLPCESKSHSGWTLAHFFASTGWMQLLKEVIDQQPDLLKKEISGGDSPIDLIESNGHSLSFLEFFNKDLKNALPAHAGLLDLLLVKKNDVRSEAFRTVPDLSESPGQKIWFGPWDELIKLVREGKFRELDQQIALVQQKNPGLSLREFWFVELVNQNVGSLMQVLIVAWPAGAQKYLEALLKRDWRILISSSAHGDLKGYSPLQMAVSFNQTQAVHALADLCKKHKKQEVLNFLTPDGASALGTALANKNVEAIRALLNAGADPHLRFAGHMHGPDGAPVVVIFTPWEFAKNAFQQGFTLFRQREKKEPKAADQDDVVNTFQRLAYGDSKEVIASLANQRFSSEQLLTPLLIQLHGEKTQLNIFQLAFLKGELEVIAQILKQYKPATALKLFLPAVGERPLHLAVQHGHLNVIEFFAEKNPPLLLEKNAAGQSVLELLIERKNLTPKILVGLRANSECLSVLGRQAFGLDFDKLAANPQANTVSSAIAQELQTWPKKQRSQALQTLLVWDLPDLAQETSSSLLHALFSGGGRSQDLAIQYLRDHPVLLVSQLPGGFYRGYTPLHLAAATGNAEMLEKLLVLCNKLKDQLKVDFSNLPALDGSTPLGLAVRSENLRSVQALYVSGADPKQVCTHYDESKNAVQISPLDLAKVQFALALDVFEPAPVDAVQPAAVDAVFPASLEPEVLQVGSNSDSASPLLQAKRPVHPMPLRNPPIKSKSKGKKGIGKTGNSEISNSANLASPSQRSRTPPALLLSEIYLGIDVAAKLLAEISENPTTPNSQASLSAASSTQSSSSGSSLPELFVQLALWEPSKSVVSITFEQHGVDPCVWSARARVLMAKLEEANCKAYFVGGTVRDPLCDMYPRDLDVVAEEKSRQVIRDLFPGQVEEIGGAHPLMRVKFACDPNKPSADDVIEISFLPGGDGNVIDKLRADAAKRDFTANALYLDGETKEIIDPEGGFVDIVNRTLRTVGDPCIRFKEDPLRIFRGVRIAAKLAPQGFLLAPETRVAMQTCMHSLNSAVVNPSRLFGETLKLFACSQAHANWQMLGSLDANCVAIDGVHNPLLALVAAQMHKRDCLTLTAHFASDSYRDAKTLAGHFLANLLWPQLLSSGIGRHGELDVRAYVEGAFRSVFSNLPPKSTWGLYLDATCSWVRKFPCVHLQQVHQQANPSEKSAAKPVAKLPGRC